MVVFLENHQYSKDPFVLEILARAHQAKGVIARSTEGQAPIINPPSPGKLHRMMEQVRASMQKVAVIALPESLLR